MSALSERLLKFFSDAPVSIVHLAGPTFVVEFINSEALRLTSVSEPEVAGRTYGEVFSDHRELKTMLKLLSSVYENGRNLTAHEFSVTRLWNRSNKTSTRYFNVTFQPTFGKNNKADGVMVFSVDVSEQVRARGTLEKLHQGLEKVEGNLQKALVARDQFLAIASHELKNPLTSMGLQVQMGKRFLQNQDGSFSIDKIHDIFEKCDRQVGRLTGLIDSLLDISRIQNGQFSLHRHETSLTNVINEVVGQLREHATQVKCHVEINFENEVHGYWDPARLSQVFENLMSNSMKYAPGSHINIHVKNDAGSAYVCFSDSGVGIAKKDQERIFERYSRVSNSANITGMGIGLFVVKELVSAHGGTVDIESDLGRGTKFNIRLPLTDGGLRH